MAPDHNLMLPHLWCQLLIKSTPQSHPHTINLMPTTSGKQQQIWCQFPTIFRQLWCQLLIKNTLSTPLHTINLMPTTSGKQQQIWCQFPAIALPTTSGKQQQIWCQFPAQLCPYFFRVSGASRCQGESAPRSAFLLIDIKIWTELDQADDFSSVHASSLRTQQPQTNSSHIICAICL